MVKKDGRKLENIGRGLYKRWSADGKSFTYLGVYADSGGQIKRTTLKNCTTRKDAETKLRELKKGVDDIKAKGYQPRINPDLTIGEIVTEYLDYARDHLKTGNGKAGIPAKALLAFFGPERKAISVSKADVESFIKWRREKPRERKAPDPETGEMIEARVKPATINRELALLRAAYNRAIANELLERNPVALVKALKENNVRDRVLTDDEYQGLLASCPEHLRLIVMTAWETGMRRGEIEGLEWNRVDLDGGFINLRPEDTKTNEGRRVPLPPALHEALRGLRAEQASQTTAIDAMPYVFRRMVQGVYQRTGNTKHSFTTACSEAKITDFHFHDLRHCFVTRMLDASIDARVVMAITGHKTDSMLRRYDAGPKDEQLKAAVQVVSGRNLHQTLPTALFRG